MLAGHEVVMIAFLLSLCCVVRAAVIDVNQSQVCINKTTELSVDFLSLLSRDLGREDLYV